MTGYAQIVDELGTPFVLEGLFGGADAEPSAMDVEDDDDDNEGGIMQIDDEDASP